MPNMGHNIFKIIIPVNLLNYFIKVINFKKIFLLLSIFKSKSNEECKKQVLNEKNFETLEKKKRSIYYSQRNYIWRSKKRAYTF